MPKKEPTLYKDTLHGLQARCGSKATAWALIRNKCHELNLQVPTMDKIVEVSEIKKPL